MYWEGEGMPYYGGSATTNSYWGTQFIYTGTNLPFLTVVGSAGSIRDMAIRCSYPLCTNANNIGVYVNGTFGWNFKNVRVDGFNYSWWIDGGAFGNVWDGMSWSPGAYTSQWYVNSAGSPNRINFLWLQNIQRSGQSDPTATTLTGASISSGTNITFTYSGTPPAWVTNGMNGYFTGVSILPATPAMGNNGATAFGAFLQSVTTTNFVISSPTTITNVTLSSAVLSESQNYVQTGPVAYFGGGEWDIGVLEPEQSILPSPAVTIASSAKVSIGKVHTENLCFTNTGSCYLIDNYSDSLQDRKSTRLNSSHIPLSRMPSSA